ncbi:response regulator [Paraglaciecola sp. 2405UD69-4]|uniref:response regulator n=1 Tax=Paraglaciecola sp. 2405UD69-4 TaxID=3391836 RepID=UPI0039C94F8B
MSYHKVRVAVVEDNGMARANIRNHLLDMGFTHISCFSNGRELKANIKRNKIDLLLMDFHLGLYKNGVEVVQDLQKIKLIDERTCVMFITYDRLPLIIGQIVNIHPEALVIKPYTINNLQKNVKNCLNLHKYLMPIYENMHDKNFSKALKGINGLITADDKPKFRSSLVKMKAQILTKLGRYQEARELYSDILKRSDKVIWAKWGLVQAMFLDGKVEQSEELLESLTDSQLTNVKACEWLARINVEKNQYNKAEKYMGQINEGELSIPASQLKAHIYQAQDRSKDAIKFLEKKRESNRSNREHFDEMSLELARCYIFEAEQKLANERQPSLKVAKYLIGAAGRKSLDPELTIRKDYMHAIVAYLEGNESKTREVLARKGMEDLRNAEICTITDAVHVWQNIGNTARAKDFLALGEEKLKHIEDENEKTVSAKMIAKGADRIGERKPQALEYNRNGLQKYAEKAFIEATEEFYKAYILFPREIAFSLNLLQSMVDAELRDYQKMNTIELLKELQSRQLNKANKKRFTDIVSRVVRKNHIYHYDISIEDSVELTKT